MKLLGFAPCALQLAIFLAMNFLGTTSTFTTDDTGIPHSNDSAVQQHLDQRAQWIEAENAERQGM